MGSTSNGFRGVFFYLWTSFLGAFCITASRLLRFIGSCNLGYFRKLLKDFFFKMCPQFSALAQKFDPKGKFRNDFLDKFIFAGTKHGKWRRICQELKLAEEDKWEKWSLITFIKVAIYCLDLIYPYDLFWFRGYKSGKKCSC